jgi:hypothetical protein
MERSIFDFFILLKNFIRRIRYMNKYITFFVVLKMGYLGLEPRTYRLKAEYSTIELVTPMTFFANFFCWLEYTLFSKNSVLYYECKFNFEFLPI